MDEVANALDDVEYIVYKGINDMKAELYAKIEYVYTSDIKYGKMSIALQLFNIYINANKTSQEL